VIARSLAERLAELRSQLPAGPPRPATEERAGILARWFEARVELTDGGATVVVERRVGLPAAEARALAAVPTTAYLDTETTGLSSGVGTVPFLAGVGVVDGDSLVLRQLLLPDYPHERALLRRLCGELASRPRMVTYNGRGFDLPLLVTRLTMHGFFSEQASLPAQHDDLLPVARRLWRRVVGGARLAEIEQAVLGVRRTLDCPSAEVPARYFGYLRDGSPEPLAAVLDHNLQDIVSLARLDATVLLLRAGGWRTAWPIDHGGLALELLRSGDVDSAGSVLEHALAASERHEGYRLRRMATRLLVAAGEVDRAESIWREGTRAGSLEAAWSWIEVARLRERLRGDLRGALDAASAADRVLDIAFALGRGGGMQEIGRARLVVRRRLRRLKRWVAAAERRLGRAAA
jgi:uncharacterized protein YprB with RNaseH-like and TPR domain